MVYVYVIMIVFADAMNLDFTYFDYNANYKRWNKLNWFDVVLVTSVIYILFFPLSIGHDICRLIRWIFTVGRKDY